MGLDISHDAFSGAYSSFSRLRGFMCAALGGSYPPHADETLDRGCWYWPEGKGYNKKYPALTKFFSHSDCDGYIHPKTALKLAEEIDDVMPLFELYAKTTGVGAFGRIFRDGGYVAVIKKLQAGAKRAGEAGERLEFR